MGTPARRLFHLDFKFLQAPEQEKTCRPNLFALRAAAIEFGDLAR
jgi:hypothetical protein